MAAAQRDASKEHAPIEKQKNPAGGHPRPRKGATAKKRAKESGRRQQ